MSVPSERDDAIEEMAEIIDIMIPLSTLGPVGAALEVIDEQVIESVLRALAQIRSSPEKRKERKDARLARRMARKLAKGDRP